MVLQNIKDDLNLDTISLSDPFGNDSNSTYGDVIPSLEDPYQKLENSLVDSELLALLKTSLRDSEYYVLYYKILSGDDINFRELANTFCVSYQRIEQLLYNVIKKVRGFYDRERKIRKRVPQDIQDLIDTGVFNYSPIDPHSITRFLFIRDNLDEVEREIMRDVFFG